MGYAERSAHGGVVLELVGSALLIFLLETVEDDNGKGEGSPPLAAQQCLAP